MGTIAASRASISKTSTVNVRPGIMEKHASASVTLPSPATAEATATRKESVSVCPSSREKIAQCVGQTCLVQNVKQYANVIEPAMAMDGVTQMVSVSATGISWARHVTRALMDT